MTLALHDFVELAAEALGIDLTEESPHRDLLSAGPKNLHIVAGPGTGKTSALALLALKAIFVDGHPTAALVATTFTRKAARELASRITVGLHRLLQATGQPFDVPAFDVSRIRIGTIDEICHAALVERQLGVLADQLIQNGTMTQAAFNTQIARAGTNDALRVPLLVELEELFGAGRGTERLSTIRARLSTVRQRIGQDQIDRELWTASGDGPSAVAQVLNAYDVQLAEDGRLDFISVEEEFRDGLADGSLADWLDPVRVLLVDEYQDTNALQESIYQPVAAHATGNGGWIALVGDDDQSLFRFRGATVELFVDAPSRFQQAVSGMPIETLPLNVNRRSSLPIVSFANRYVALDDAYQAARVPNKPDLVGSAAREGWSVSDGIPVLGLFRPSADELGEALTRLIEATLADGFDVPGAAEPIRQQQPGDIAVIGFSTRRWSGDRRRVYDFLEHRLSALDPAISLFNPRGVQLHEMPSVQRLLGLALLCLDSEGEHAPSTIEWEVRPRIVLWRDQAAEFIASAPEPNTPHTLDAFVSAWRTRQPQRSGGWPRAFPVMELLHELSTWLPELHRSPGVIYWEALTRTLASVSSFYGANAGLIRTDDWEAAVMRLYHRFFIPIARGEVDLDEDVLESLPVEAVNALTVHQAKGLEFPICLVDVGSDFRTNHWKQARTRFPRLNDIFDPYTLEDRLRPFGVGAPPTMERQALDRAFDDIVRRNFVAYTRAQHMLVLFGCGEPEAGPNNRVLNVGTGWSRDRTQGWDSLEVTLI